MVDLHDFFTKKANQYALSLLIIVVLISIFVQFSHLGSVHPSTSSLLVPFPNIGCVLSKSSLEKLNQSTTRTLRFNKKSTTLYALKPGETIKEITQELYLHSNTSKIVKNSIIGKHRYFVFSYPSDGLKIKGYLSLPADLNKPIPLIVLLRGGSGIFGLPHPEKLSAQEGYAVICTTNRGSVSEGHDEYGGNDVNDVLNLLNFLPILEQRLNILFHPTDKYMVGYSRGGMQLFLTLGRYPEIQQKIKKVASISGQLNLSSTIQARPYLKNYYKENFGLGGNEKAWFAKRQPVNYVSKIALNLPIMIAQGSDDTRICLSEGYALLQAFHDRGHFITYVEIEGGNHILRNTPDFIPVLMDWLEQE
jgi:dipeptidyl aminopeptidase/acylaminoacyl peptidase